MFSRSRLPSGILLLLPQPYPREFKSYRRFLEGKLLDRRSRMRRPSSSHQNMTGLSAGTSPSNIANNIFGLYKILQEIGDFRKRKGIGIE